MAIVTRPGIYNIPRRCELDPTPGQHGKCNVVELRGGVGEDPDAAADPFNQCRGGSVGMCLDLADEPVGTIDDGAPFDPTAYVLPELPSSLADASGGGRGIRLVRHFADQLLHRRKADGNQLTLVFSR